MRILSHDGKIDMPYELTALSISYKISGSKMDKNVFCVNAHSNSLNAKRVIMGEYSSEQKAKKAMEILQMEYMFENQFETICCGTTDYSSKPTYYFQFPADDEIEV